MKDNTKATARIILILGILFTVVSPYLFTRSYGILDLTKSGNIGSTIGGITAPIVSLVGSCLLFLALTLQSKTNISLREQINDQKEQYKEQNINNYFNEFEKHYFQLLKYFRDLAEFEYTRIINKIITFEKIVPNFENLENFFIEQIKNDERKIYGIFSDKDYEYNLKEQLGEISLIYIKDIYKVEYFEKDFGHYFRSLYHLIRYVDEYPNYNDSTAINKKKYIDLIQAYMNDSELYLCFIGGLGYNDNKDNIYGNNFAIYLEDYLFLENILSKGVLFKYLFSKYYPKNYKKWNQKGGRQEYETDFDF